MSNLILRGEELELDTISLNIVVQEKLACVTVSALTVTSSDVPEPVFAYTHFVEFEDGVFPELDDLTVPAINAFKSALNDQGGVLVDGEESS